MGEATNYIDDVGALLRDIASVGFSPVLVGGMALVIMGSRRVTRDFDFLVDVDARENEDLLNILYKHGLYLVAKVDENGDVVATIDNKNVAAARLKIDKPDGAYFYNAKTGLRVDFLFDFPVPVNEILAGSVKKKIRSYVFQVAGKSDLVKLKKIASQKRSQSFDLQDLEFLKGDFE